MFDAYRRGAISSWDPVITATIFAVLIGFYLAQGLQQAFDRTPVMVVGPDGLFLRPALSSPIPWRRIARVDCFVAALRPSRIEIEVDAETYTAMRFGLRILGDNIVRRNALRHIFAIYPRGYDRSASEIFTALKQYWPPRG